MYGIVMTKERDGCKHSYWLQKDLSYLQAALEIERLQPVTEKNHVVTLRIVEQA